MPAAASRRPSPLKPRARHRSSPDLPAQDLAAGVDLDDRHERGRAATRARRPSGRPGRRRRPAAGRSDPARRDRSPRPRPRGDGARARRRHPRRRPRRDIRAARTSPPWRRGSRRPRGWRSGSRVSWPRRVVRPRAAVQVHADRLAPGALIDGDEPPALGVERGRLGGRQHIDLEIADGLPEVAERAGLITKDRAAGAEDPELAPPPGERDRLDRPGCRQPPEPLAPVVLVEGQVPDPGRPVLRAGDQPVAVRAEGHAGDPRRYARG